MQEDAETPRVHAEILVDVPLDSAHAENKKCLMWKIASVLGTSPSLIELTK